MCAVASDSQTVLNDSGDRGASALAERQGGAISTAQLRAAGLGDGAIKHRAARGRLHPIHRGVWAGGHPLLTPRRRLWAAVLACGGLENAVISHFTAAAEWGLSQGSGERVHLFTLGASHSTKAIRVHRSRTLDAELDVFEQGDGLRITSVART